MIAFSHPGDGPYDCFHPESRGPGIALDDGLAPSVAAYCLAQRFASVEDRERICRAAERGFAEALQIASALEPARDWKQRQLVTLEKAVRQMLESDLTARAVLLGTGDEKIEARIEDPWLGTGPDGKGRNVLGRLLEQLRVTFRNRDR